MKRTIGILTALVLALSIPTANAFAGTGLKVAQGKKNITLRNEVGENLTKFLSDAPLEKIEGVAKEVSGSFVIDADNVEATTGTITVKTKSMNSGLARRDEHMMGSEWLDAEQYPTIVFTVKSLSNVKIIKAEGGMAEIQATANGDFTMHGATKQLSAPITLRYVRESDATKKRASGDFAMVEAKFSVSLRDYNVKGRGSMVGSKVGETIGVEAKLFGSTAQ